MTEPTTRAGREMLVALREHAPWFLDGSQEREIGHILAIEAEARADALREAQGEYDLGYVDARRGGAHRDAGNPDRNHYDRFFPDGPPQPMTAQWLNDTEAKMREGLGDPFVDDAAAVMLRLIATIREAQAAGNERLRRHVAAIEAERDVALVKAKHGDGMAGYADGLGFALALLAATPVQPEPEYDPAADNHGNLDTYEAVEPAAAPRETAHSILDHVQQDFDARMAEMAAADPIAALRVSALWDALRPDDPLPGEELDRLHELSRRFRAAAMLFPPTMGAASGAESTDD